MKELQAKEYEIASFDHDSFANQYLHIENIVIGTSGSIKILNLNFTSGHMHQCTI